MEDRGRQDIEERLISWGVVACDAGFAPWKRARGKEAEDGGHGPVLFMGWVGMVEVGINTRVGLEGRTAAVDQQVEEALWLFNGLVVVLRNGG